MSIEKALQILQKAVEERFGKDVVTDTGAATLTIARDRIELHDERHRLVAEGDDVAGALLGSPT